MTYRLRSLIQLGLMTAAITGLLLSSTALAGGKATLVTTNQPTPQPGRSAPAGTSGPKTEMTITWRDVDTLRMEMGDEGDYLLMRDGKAYSVSQSDGQTMVMDMEGMGAMVQAMASKGGQNKNPFGSIDSVEATGKTDTVAGIKGRVYHMTWTDPDGSPKSGEAVLTDDPLAVEMTRAYFTSTGSMVGMDITNAFLDALPGKDRGLLRMGEQLQVESISRADPPASTFKLPAKPVSLREMMSGMGNP